MADELERMVAWGELQATDVLRLARAIALEVLAAGGTPHPRISRLAHLQINQHAREGVMRALGPAKLYH